MTVEVSPRGPRLTAEQQRLSAESAQQAYGEQALLAATAALAAAELWQQVDPALDPALFLAMITEMVDEFGADALALAVAEYDRQRQIAGLPPFSLPVDIVRFGVTIPAGSSLADVAIVLDVGTRDRSPGQLAATDATYDVLRRVDRRLRERSPRDRQLAFEATEAIVSHRSLAPARHLVTDLAEDAWLAGETDQLPFDQEILGWYRRTDGDPCAFCAMLASRGAIYSTRFTAGVSITEKPQLDGAYNASWHPSCGCQAVALFTTDLDVPELNLELRALWFDVTEGLSGADARSAYRRAIRVRSARLAEESDV